MLNMTILELDELKNNVRNYLLNLGYSEEDTDFVNDIVGLSRPGVALFKEQIMGEYTGGLMEMYL